MGWATQDTHLGLYRNYFGEDIDDVFIADNEWSRRFQCTPAATDPPDYCVDTAVTTCINQPATEAGLLASETHIMMSHVLANDPRVSYAHQSDLIGPASQSGPDYGYTILTLIGSMLSQYNAWFTAAAPLDHVTDVTDAQGLAEQGGWASAAASGQVSATETGGMVTITNNGSGADADATKCERIGTFRHQCYLHERPITA